VVSSAEGWGHFEMEFNFHALQIVPFQSNKAHTQPKSTSIPLTP